MTKIADGEQSPNRDRAVALHREGRVREAAALYKALLAKEPANGDILGLLSIAQLRLGEEGEALANWRKSLPLSGTVQERLRNIANFLLAMRQMHETKSSQPKHEAPKMEFLDEVTIPDWPSGLPLSSGDRTIIVELGECLLDFGRKDQARRLVDGALASMSSDPDFLAAVAPFMIKAGRARRLCELLTPLTSGPHGNNGALLIAHAAAARACDQLREAKTLDQRAKEAVPVYLTRKMPTQRMLIGVLNSPPTIISRAMSPAALHFSKNTPATLAEKMGAEFRFLSIFPGMPATEKSLGALPRPQLIINNWVNAEVLERKDTLEFISAHADSFGVPVINHPRRASLTTRQRNAECLAGIPHVIVPRLIRITNEPATRALAIRAIEQGIGFPVIIRNPFGQAGWETAKIDTPAELAAHLAAVQRRQLYAIEYVHNPTPEGAYRKIRANVIGGELFVAHVYFGARWNVHRAKDRTNINAFDARETAAAFAKAIVSRPQEALGREGMAALHEIRRRVPLDIFGIDFDLMPDGRILFFEANAAVNLNMRERENLPETLEGMRKAYRRLFDNPPPPAPDEAAMAVSTNPIG